jgi:hypothetical protein
MFRDPLLNLRQVLVLLLDVLLDADVNQIYDRLRCNEVVLVEEVDVLSGPLGIADILHIIEKLLYLHEHLHLVAGRLRIRALDHLVEVFNLGLEVLLVLGDQLPVNDVHVPDGVNIALLVNDLLALEATHHMVDTVDCLDV